jgi:hypothetical protein
MRVQKPRTKPCTWRRTNGLVEQYDVKKYLINDYGVELGPDYNSDIAERHKAAPRAKLGIPRKKKLADSDEGETETTGQQSDDEQLIARVHTEALGRLQFFVTDASNPAQERFRAAYSDGYELIPTNSLGLICGFTTEYLLGSHQM